MKLINNDLSVLSEEELIDQAKTDQAAFKPIYEKYYKLIFLFILHRVGDKQTSADITSQVFLKAMLSLKQYQHRGIPFSAWLYRIAINECHGYFRQSKKERLVVLDEQHTERLY